MLPNPLYSSFGKCSQNMCYILGSAACGRYGDKLDTVPAPACSLTQKMDTRTAMKWCMRCDKTAQENEGAQRTDGVPQKEN